MLSGPYRGVAMIGTVAAAAVILGLPFALVVAAVSDLFTMTIPNRISVAVIVAFIFLAPLCGLAWPAFAMSFAAALAVFAVCFALFALNIMGGGDAKLLTAAALWFGYDQSLLIFLLAVAYAGGAVTLLVLVIRAKAPTVMALGIPVPPSLATMSKIPYGVAIAIGGLFTIEHAPIYELALKMLG
jgi:prepilin peptidase CpaA